MRPTLVVASYALQELPSSEWIALARVAQAIAAHPAFGIILNEPIRYFYGSLASDLFTEAREAGEPAPELTEDEIEAWVSKLDDVFREHRRERELGGMANKAGWPGVGVRPGRPRAGDQPAIRTDNGRPGRTPSRHNDHRVRGPKT